MYLECRVKKDTANIDLFIHDINNHTFSRLQIV